MTTSLVSSLIQLGLIILTPFYFFARTASVLHISSAEHKNFQSPPEKLETKQTKGDIPVHTLSTFATDSEQQQAFGGTSLLIEWCSFVSETLTVLCLIFCIHLRKLWIKLCLSLMSKQQQQQQMDTELAMGLQDFDSEERKSLKAFDSDPLIESLLYHGCPATNRIKEAVPDSYLLQFASLLDDTTAQKCIADLGRTYDPDTKHSLFGLSERRNGIDHPWEKRLEKRKGDVYFFMDRKYLRHGLYVYRSTAIFEDAKVDDFRRFILDPAKRLDWDWSTLDIKVLQTENEASEMQDCSESYFIFTENKMPGPLCNREYVAARRVWNRTDGGCYCITKSARHPNAPSRKKRNVRVDDYTAAFVIKPRISVKGEKMQAVEMTSLYFDNAKMRPMAYNIAMNASMWTGILTTETGFRKFLLDCNTTSDFDGSGGERLMTPSPSRASEALCVRPKTVFGGVFIVSVVFLFATLGTSKSSRRKRA